MTRHQEAWGSDETNDWTFDSCWICCIMRPLIDRTYSADSYSCLSGSSFNSYHSCLLTERLLHENSSLSYCFFRVGSWARKESAQMAISKQLPCWLEILQLQLEDHLAWRENSVHQINAAASCPAHYCMGKSLEGIDSSSYSYDSLSLRICCQTKASLYCF